MTNHQNGLPCSCFICMGKFRVVKFEHDGWEVLKHD